MILGLMEFSILYHKNQGSNSKLFLFIIDNRQHYLYFSPTFRNVSSYRYFHLKKETILWDSDLEIFYPLHGLDKGATAGFFHKQNGLSREEQDRR